LLRQSTRRLWVRATLIGALGIAAAGLASLTDQIAAGYRFRVHIGEDAVGSLLTIIASSMLSVTIFSLSVMTSSFATAASSTTPRATRLLAEDRITHNILSVFIGAFLFSIVGLVVLKAGAYAEHGLAILFIVTIAVLSLVVVSLMRWIHHLTSFGRTGDTIRRVEEATREAIDTRLEKPDLGGRPLSDLPAPMPTDALAVVADDTGYIVHIDMERLAQGAERLGAPIALALMPGQFVHAGSTLAWLAIRPEEPEDAADDLRGAFTIGFDRDFQQDPGYGIAVLSEIALRALSPAVNDPGTAIDVVGRMARLLDIWATGHQHAQAEAEAGNAPERPFRHIYAPPLTCDTLFTEAFAAIARDGAAQIELHLALRRSLHALAQKHDGAVREAARKQATLALKRAEAAMTLDEDRAALRAIAVG